MDTLGKFVVFAVVVIIVEFLVSYCSLFIQSS